MKNSLFLFLLSLVTYSGIEAQNLNSITPRIADYIPDGWHKFKTDTASFDVEIKDEQFVEGNIVWANGARYAGMLKGYAISGKGTYYWPNRERYEGKFKKNMRHGKGTMYYLDGSKHYGKWVNNKKHGKGQEYDKSGNLVRDGVWENDVFVEGK